MQIFLSGMTCIQGASYYDSKSLYCCIFIMICSNCCECVCVHATPAAGWPGSADAALPPPLLYEVAKLHHLFWQISLVVVPEVPLPAHLLVG